MTKERFEEIKNRRYDLIANDSIHDLFKEIECLEATIERLTRELDDAHGSMRGLADVINSKVIPWEKIKDTNITTPAILEAENAKLRTENQKMAELLDQAPHTIYCHQRLGVKCDCWKKEADALISS